MCLHVNIYVHECVSTDPLMQKKKKSPSVVLQGSESLSAGCGSVCLKVSVATSGGRSLKAKPFLKCHIRPWTNNQASLASTHTLWSSSLCHRWHRYTIHSSYRTPRLNRLVSHDPTLSRFTWKADMRVTPGCPVPGEWSTGSFSVTASGKVGSEALASPSLCKCKRTGGITALVLSKQKACHLSTRFIDSVSPISSNGYHREWLGETWSHNEAQIITTSPKFAQALSLSRSAPPPNSRPVRLSLCSIKGIRQERRKKLERKRGVGIKERKLRSELECFR